MGFSPLISGTIPVGKTPQGYNRYTSRNGYSVKYFIVHHAAGGWGALTGAFVNRSREVSANYAMDIDGSVYGAVDEAYRAFTSSAFVADGQAITIEVANSGIGGDWPISNASFESLARLIADCATRHGFPINRDRVIGHREVIGKFGKGVATVCPGPYLWARMDSLVQRARQIQAGGGSPSAPSPKPPVKTPAQIEEEELMAQKDDINRHTDVKLEELYNRLDARLTTVESRNRADTRGFIHFIGADSKDETYVKSPHAIHFSLEGLPYIMHPPTLHGTGQRDSMRMGGEGNDYRWVDPTRWGAPLSEARFWNKTKDNLTRTNWFGDRQYVTFEKAQQFVLLQQDELRRLFPDMYKGK